MSARVSFFPVGCGDMVLIRLEGGQHILIDCNIRQAAEDPEDQTFDAIAALRERLEVRGRDSSGRLYLDVFSLSHPDRDHCLGLERHFHLGAPKDWKADDDKIFVREIWSSPIIFRRLAREGQSVCEDAKAFNREAHRRLAVNQTRGYVASDGDRMLILGEDENGKSDPHEAIVVQVGGAINAAAGRNNGDFEALLLAPLPSCNDEDEEELLAKNRSSVILRFKLKGGWKNDAVRFLTGGDAGVAIWERQWKHHADDDALSYDLLLSPHHCSWRSLSYDSWSEMGEDAEVSADARAALSQVRDPSHAAIVSSSKPISDDDADPPCTRAKREYVEMVGWEGRFYCTEDTPAAVLEFDLTPSGLQRVRKTQTRASVGTGTVIHG